MRQAPAPGGLEDAGGGGEAVGGHALAADVEDARGVTLKALWLGVGTWPRARTLGGVTSEGPAEPPRRKARSGRRRAASKKKASTRASRSGQAVAEEAEVGREARVGRDGVVGGGVEAVVDGDAAAAPKSAVARDHRIAAAVGEDEGPDRSRAAAEGVGGVGGDLGQRGGGVHVPEDGDGLAARRRRGRLEEASSS
jgi:hypothetical protein